MRPRLAKRPPVIKARPWKPKAITARLLYVILWCGHPDCRVGFTHLSGPKPTICPKCERDADWRPKPILMFTTLDRAILWLFYISPD